MSLLLAREAALVHGLELQDEAIAAAAENARLAGAANVAFAAGDVRTLLLDPPTGRDPDVARLVVADGKPHHSLRTPASSAFKPPAVVVTDPPRAGMAKKAVERMALLGAERIVYVSCNPATLAANAAQLADHRLQPRHGHACRHVPAHPPRRGGGDLHPRRRPDGQLHADGALRDRPGDQLGADRTRGRCVISSAPAGAADARRSGRRWRRGRPARAAAGPAGPATTARSPRWPRTRPPWPPG